ncbi:MAG: pyruvate ferredoxin oxidoreductase [Thermoplasmata archaeon]|nr:pyruvate ferredoxin oxidoreductase [Thermoplasmata archaeon]
MKMVMTGNYASAYGAKVCRAEVISAYPITPQTSIVEKIATLVSSGEMKAQFVKVESEHSAMAALISASMAGARTYTATSSHGLLLMHELLIWSAGARTPIVMSNVCRANGPPWSVWVDHHDSIAQRDTGWMQVFCEGNQEVLDSIIMGYKLSEREDIRLPTMINEDAFILSHTVEPVDVPDMELVDSFLPPYNPRFRLDVDEPYGFGSLVMPDMYMEFRYKLNEAMEAARQGWRDVEKDFEKHFGRNHGGLVEFYQCEGADAVLIMAGSIASTAKDVVDKLRSQGKKVGLARIRVFRPFPVEEIRKLAGMTNILAMCDHSYTFGHWGPMAQEVRGALYGTKDMPMLKNYIVGLGGKDMTPEVIEKLFLKTLELKSGLDSEIEWIGVKGHGEW